MYVVASWMDTARQCTDLRATDNLYPCGSNTRRAKCSLPSTVTQPYNTRKNLGNSLWTDCVLASIQFPRRRAAHYDKSKMKLLATCLVSAGVLLGRCSGECEEKSWCKTAPSTKPLDDGSENPRCKRWVDDCPCTCAGAVLQVEEDRRLEQQKEAEQAAIEATWTHHSGGGTKYVTFLDGRCSCFLYQLYCFPMYPGIYCTTSNTEKALICKKKFLSEP